MAPGVTLAVIGAVLTFAIRAQPSFIDLRVVGLILMVAGAALIWHSRRGAIHERVVTRTRDRSPQYDPSQPGQQGGTTRETIQERDYE